MLHGHWHFSTYGESHIHDPIIIHCNFICPKVRGIVTGQNLAAPVTGLSTLRVAWQWLQDLDLLYSAGSCHGSLCVSQRGGVTVHFVPRLARPPETVVLQSFPRGAAKVKNTGKIVKKSR